MKVILDANIFVSAMVNTLGNPRRIMLAWEQGAIEVVLSQAILGEIGRVLRYPRIARRHKQEEGAIERFLRMLEDEAEIVEPAERLGIVERDESDNRYLECAVEGRAQYLVSGDSHLLDIGEYRGIIILSPAAFVALVLEGTSGG